VSLSRSDRAALVRALGVLLATSALVGLALAASCGLGCAAVRRHVTVQDGHPAVMGELDYVPARHSDGGQP